MDVGWIAGQLANYVKTQNGTQQLVLPASNSLGSNDIAHLISQFFDSQLTITLDGAPSIGNAVVYTGSVDFLGATSAASASFHVFGDAAELTLTLTPPADWTFSKSFSTLQGTVFDRVELTNPSLVLNSTAETL